MKIRSTFRLLLALLVLKAFSVTGNWRRFGLWRIPMTLEGITGRVVTHDVGQRLHIVCASCSEAAPPWWEFSTDCAGHNCGVCFVCQDEAEEQAFIDIMIANYYGEFAGDKRA